MGTVTRLDPNTTNNLASQPGANAGQSVDQAGDHHACHVLHAVRLRQFLRNTAELSVVICRYGEADAGIPAGWTMGAGKELCSADGRGSGSVHSIEARPQDG